MPNSATFVTTTYGLSYVSVGEADNYFDDQLYPEPWPTLDAAMKEKALVAATKKIDTLNLVGRKATPEQEFEFPRTIYSHAKKHWIQETEISHEVIYAVCEEALTLIRQGAASNKRAELQRQGVTSFTISKLSESYGENKAVTSGVSSPLAAKFMSRYTDGMRVIR